MITAIIFSKNRACQLDLLLRSIYEHSDKLFDDILVLYEHTTEDFKKGYDKLLNTHCSRVKFWEEKNFKDDTLGLVLSAKEHIAFFVDDNIIYRQLELTPEVVTDLFNIETFCSLSLRLGLNTTIQDCYRNTPMHFPTLYQYKDVYFWNWRECPKFSNFGYPFTVDGNIYRKKDILNVMDFDFDTPNSFEGRFVADTFVDLMGCLEVSSLVNNPLNLVGSSENAAGKHFGKTLEELNEAFVNGQEIDLDHVCANKIIASHQEMEIKLV